MDQLAALTVRVERLEAIDAIRQLKARYLRACDLKQPEVVRDTLLPDGAVIDFEGFPPFAGRDDFVALYAQMACQPGVHDMHHASNGEITLTGPDTAEGRWSLHFQTILLAPRQVITFGVEYDDRYVRRDGRWWIAETRSRRTGALVHQYDAAGVPVAVVMGEAPAAFGDS